jgi:hypothetical protein
VNAPKWSCSAILRRYDGAITRKKTSQWKRPFNRPINQDSTIQRPHKLPSLNLPVGTKKNYLVPSLAKNTIKGLYTHCILKDFAPSITVFARLACGMVKHELNSLKTFCDNVER